MKCPGHRGRADDLCDAAGRVERLEIHLPEAERGGDVTLGQEEVVVVRGEDVRDAPVVPGDPALVAQSGYSERFRQQSERSPFCQKPVKG